MYSLYFFGIIKSSDVDLEYLNRLSSSTKLTDNRKLHPNSSIERITISWKKEEEESQNKKYYITGK